jgi:hypothetical protein
LGAAAGHETFSPSTFFNQLKKKKKKAYDDQLCAKASSSCFPSVGKTFFPLEESQLLLLLD